MATFGKRAAPKHRASPSDRRRASTPVSRPGSHAATTAPAEVAPPEAAPAEVAPPEAAPAEVAPPEVAPLDAPAEVAPLDAPAPVEPARLDAPTPAPPAAPELVTQPAPELPAAPVSVPVSAPVSISAPEPAPIVAGPLRVLVVDDNEDVRGLLRIAFSRAEIEVVGSAGDYREALTVARRDRPSIVLLDVNLPQVPGLDLLPQLREACPQARVVMFSAQINSQVTEQAKERGAVGFVEKGVSMKSVVAHLHEVARAPEAQVVEPFPLKV